MGPNNSKLIKELESGQNTYLSEMIACLTTIYLKKQKKQKHIRCVENGLYWSVPKRQISVCFPNRHTFRLKKKINTKIITTEKKMLVWREFTLRVFHQTSVEQTNMTKFDVKHSTFFIHCHLFYT